MDVLGWGLLVWGLVSVGVYAVFVFRKDRRRVADRRKGLPNPGRRG